MCLGGWEEASVVQEPQFNRLRRGFAHPLGSSKGRANLVSLLNPITQNVTPKDIPSVIEM